MTSPAGHAIDLPLEDHPQLLDEHGPLFLSGCPRSGTTFLSNAINAIPRVEEFIGVIAPPRMMHLIGQRSEAGESVEQELRVMRDIFWVSFIRRSTFMSERVGAVVWSRRGLLDLRRRGTIAGKTMLYKEPFMAFAIGPVAQHFASSRILHIVRDGRDNADSLVRRYGDALSDRVLTDPFLSGQKNSEIGAFETVDGFNFPWWIAEDERELFRASSKYVRNVMLWREMTRRIVAVGKTLPADRFLQVRYEDMVNDKVGTAEAITAFLGGTDPRHLLRALAGAHARSIGIHRQHQAPSEIATADKVAGPLLAELGFA
jgi:hypothetical protein